MTLPNKDKEQHFLVNVEILDKEIDEANISKEDKIIEIGAGDGKLTRELIKKAGWVLAFEIDTRFEKNLKKIQEEAGNLEVSYSSALDSSWNGFNKIVSNIPYSLSGVILEKAISDNIEELTLIVGENFKETLESQEKIGLIANLFFNIEFINKVDKNSFFPEPRVNSWLIKLKRKKGSKQDKINNKILRNILLSKRTIKNAIVYSFVEEGFTKNDARKFILENKFDNNAINKSVKNITGKIIQKLEVDLENLKL